jgi:biopolymer transport protein ExbD
MKLRSPPAAAPPLPMAALVDILFIVLCFLFLVARFADSERVDVVLPSTDAGVPIVDRPVVVTLVPDGGVEVDGVRVDEALLGQVLAEKRRGTDRALVIADRATPLQRAVDALAAARRAGFPLAGIATVAAEPPP